MSNFQSVVAYAAKVLMSNFEICLGYSNLLQHSIGFDDSQIGLWFLKLDWTDLVDV